MGLPAGAVPGGAAVVEDCGVELLVDAARDEVDEDFFAVAFFFDDEEGEELVVWGDGMMLLGGT